MQLVILFISLFFIIVGIYTFLTTKTKVEPKVVDTKAIYVDTKHVDTKDVEPKVVDTKAIYVDTKHVDTKVVEPKVVDTKVVDVPLPITSPILINGVENDTSNFSCKIKSGSIIYGIGTTEPITFDIPSGTSSLIVNNNVIGGDPDFGNQKKWSGSYTC